MTDYTVARGGPDWWSRWMAVGSLLVAGVALYYTYDLQSNLKLSNQQSQLKSDSTIQAALRPTGERQPDGDQAIESNPASRPSEATETPVADHTGQPSDRNAISWDDPADQGRPSNDARLAEQQTPASEPASSDEQDPLDDLLDKPMEPPAEAAPRLVAVRTTFRPTGQSESVTAVVRNVGDGDAQISELLFRPDEVVELPRGASRPDWSATDETQLVLFFDDADNLTVTQGKHGNYVRILPERFTVAAGNDANINLAIKNSNHTGYGLQGRLTLRLNSGDDYHIDEVTLAFVE